MGLEACKSIKLKAQGHRVYIPWKGAGSGEMVTGAIHPGEHDKGTKQEDKGKSW